MESVEWRRGPLAYNAGADGGARARTPAELHGLLCSDYEWREGERDAVMESDRRVVALFAAAATA